MERLALEPRLHAQDDAPFGLDLQLVLVGALAEPHPEEQEARGHTARPRPHQEDAASLVDRLEAERQHARRSRWTPKDSSGSPIATCGRRPRSA